jgi:hypothetical protein
MREGGGPTGRHGERSKKHVAGVVGDLELVEEGEEFFLEGAGAVVCGLVEDVLNYIVVGALAHGESGVAVLPAKVAGDFVVDPLARVALEGGGEVGDGEGWGEGAIDVDVVGDAAGGEGFGFEIFEDAAEVGVEAGLPVGMDLGEAFGSGPDEVTRVQRKDMGPPGFERARKCRPFRPRGWEGRLRWPYGHRYQK